MKIFLKRKYQTLGLIAVVGIIFYLLQALTMSQLGHASRKMEANKLIKDMLSDDDENSPVIISRNRIIDGDSKFHFDDKEAQFKNIQMDKDVIKMREDERKKKEEATKNLYLENNYIKEANEKDKISTKELKKNVLQKGRHIKSGGNATSDRHNNRRPPFVRGVLPRDLIKYQLDSANMFHCLDDTQVTIRGDQVNDDYCDCPDSSDEPGTSACPNGRFYCHRQIPGFPSQSVPSSRVNDGICDCCDGSDEWHGDLPPDFMRIKDGEWRAVVDHAPCSDRCGDIVAKHKQEDVLIAQGKKLQAKYLKQAQTDLKERERSKFGPGGVFYPLSKNCYTLEADHYTYKVCPFHKVTQSAASKKEVVLGKTPTMHLDRVKGQGQVEKHVLVMSDGESHLCPFNRHRTAKIEMVCGLQDQVQRVQENELCVYSFTMITPAAC